MHVNKITRVNFVELNNVKRLYSLSGGRYFIFEMCGKCQVSIQCDAEVFQVVGKWNHLLTMSKMCRSFEFRMVTFSSPSAACMSRVILWW
jgi:hypothetical protein